MDESKNQYHKNYYLTHKEYFKNYNANHKQQIKEWKEQNKEHYNQYQNEYHKQYHKKKYSFSKYKQKSIKKMITENQRRADEYRKQLASIGE
jgi:hypothetical protein